MSANNTKHASGEHSLRRTRSVGDEPTSSQDGLVSSSAGSSRTIGDAASSSTVITLSKDVSCSPRSAGPSFNAFSIPEENSTNMPRTPPPAVLHTPPTTPSPPAIPASNTTLDQPIRPQYPANSSTITRLFHFFGYGPDASKVRRALVSLIWNLAWGFAQMVVIVSVLGSSAPRASPTVPGANEWSACDRPLGVWSILWLARVVVACVLAYWGWTRDKSTQSRNNRQDVESAPNASPASPLPQQASPQSQQPAPSGRSAQSQSARVPHTPMFRRLSLFSSLFSLTWFLTAHILIYTSLKTCRFSSPHIWWLVFGILCITYLMILEVILLSLVVFVFAPVIFLFWNIFLLCLGRHPLQNPLQIKPDIGKLPKAMVDKIPLVYYIPPPPDAPPTEGPIQIPETVYSYPPKPPAKVTDTPAKKRFKFMKFKKSPSNSEKNSTDASTTKDSSKTDKSGSWEDNWDTEGYPSVVLGDNRAACAICLLDFEEPKRLHPVPETEEVKAKAPEVTSQAVEVISEEAREDDQLRLTDAGEGAQPLRLLRCGHVFHKTCLDPWLTDVSGRCPVCQRPVEIPEPDQKQKKGRR